MGIGAFSEEEKKVLNQQQKELIGKGDWIRRELKGEHDGLRDQLETIIGKLDKELNSITQAAEKMRAGGNIILDDESLRTRCQQLEELKEMFEQQEGSLRELQGEFQKAISEYTQKTRELAQEKRKQEEAFAKRRNELEKDYEARGHDYFQKYADAIHGTNESEKKQLNEIIALRDALREMQERHTQSIDKAVEEYRNLSRRRDEEHCARVQAHFDAVAADYHELDEKKKALDEREKELQNEEQKLSDRKNDLEVEHRRNCENDYAAINEKLAELEDAWNELSKEKQKLQRDKEEIAKARMHLEGLKVEAEQGFAAAHAQALNGVTEHSKHCLSQIIEAQKQDADRRAESMAEFQKILSDERARELRAFSDALAERRSQEENAWAARKAQQDKREDDLSAWEDSLKKKKDELDARQASLESFERALKKERECKEHQLMLDIEKYRAEAEAEKRAAEDKVRIAEGTREKWLNELQTIRAQLDALRLMSARFGDKTLEQIDREIRQLEQEKAALEQENIRLRHASAS